jgi:uncharacterized protein YoxC
MLDPFYKQDVFFFVTTIAIVVLTILLSVLIIYIIKITKDVSYISKKAKGQADLISEDISELRENVKEQGLKLKHFTGFFNKLRKKK